MSRCLQAAFVVTLASVVACEPELPTNPPQPEVVPSAKPTVTTTVTENPPQPTATATAAPSASASAGLPTAPPRQRITMAADGSCSYMHHYDIDCPDDGTTCNPPEPEMRTVQCPDVPADARIEKLTAPENGADCLAKWFPKCPEDNKCNPPPVEVALPCAKAPSKPRAK